MLSVCFIDRLGLKYSGDTIIKRGLGGSESAIIYIGRELAALGFLVTVYNHCETEGIYDGVTYIDISKIRENTHVFDILISSRSILPLVPQKFGFEVWDKFEVDIGVYESIAPLAKHKIIWMHDTFLEGEEFLEPLLVNNSIQEVFLLSDWHTHYISQSDHFGTKKRDYANIKTHIYQTRNGMHPYLPSPNIQCKDKDLFVYNSSYSKGMPVLVRKIWPEVKKQIPSAKLIVIGGYYRGAGENETADEQEIAYFKLREEFDNKYGIRFTGVITQKEIAEILLDATFMIYPPSFPETFGISTLEALYYGVVPITSKFGALEQTAIDDMSYQMNYEVTESDEDQQKLFINLVVNAYSDQYRTQQKQNKTRELRQVVSWQSVAIQWKNHFYRAFDIFQTREEIEKVRHISSEVNRIFKTRHINLEDQIEYFCKKKEQRLVIISPVRNAEKYVKLCIESVAMQVYDNYRHYIIDDCSTDSTRSVIKETLESLDSTTRKKFTLIENDTRVGALSNQIHTIDAVCKKKDIIILLDGDDWLRNDPDILSYINGLYPRHDMTYGSCWSKADGIPLIAQEYPEDIRLSRAYRKHHFTWGIPYTHLRTFSFDLFNKINRSELMDTSTGRPYMAAGDSALLYALLESCDPDKIKCVQRILVNYNDANPLNDYKANSSEQDRNRDLIISSNLTKKIRILIGIPCAKYIEAGTFESIYNMRIPDGCDTSFQYFYGYNIAQIRNLMADTAIRMGFDYLFWIDSDIIIPDDALVKLIESGKQCISGMYIQRREGEGVPEVYVHNGTGMRNATTAEVSGDGVIEVAACGFGCILTSTDILKKVGYPQFEYKNSLDHTYTVSEDVDFCKKAVANGVSIFVDTSIKCGHIGQKIYKINV
ncbi:MAG: glycosyltransferase [Bacteroidia bacterium]|nr:glycosyltransferase [Bacteroidia bacterium]